MSRKKVSHLRIESAIRSLLVALGQDLESEELQDTPARVARFWSEFIDYDAGTLSTAFQHTETDQLVVVGGLRVTSMCAHHLLPFVADIAIGYLPSQRVLGLSKFGRIAQQAAHKLQIQERLVQEIADSVADLAHCVDVAVLAQGTHLCMSGRGIGMPHVMTSSVMRGQFRADSALRAEFVQLATTTPRLTL